MKTFYVHVEDSKGSPEKLEKSLDESLKEPNEIQSAKKENKPPPEPIKTL